MKSSKYFQLKNTNTSFASPWEIVAPNCSRAAVHLLSKLKLLTAVSRAKSSNLLPRRNTSADSCSWPERERSNCWKATSWLDPHLLNNRKIQTAQHSSSRTDKVN